MAYGTVAYMRKLLRDVEIERLFHRSPTDWGELQVTLNKVSILDRDGDRWCLSEWTDDDGVAHARAYRISFETMYDIQIANCSGPDARRDARRKLRAAVMRKWGK